jgi:hypothetical protein
MHHYFDFDLTRLGPAAEQRARLRGTGQNGLLVIFQTSPEQVAEEQAYLEKILEASGFPTPAETCYLLPVYADEAVDLLELRLEEPVRQVVLLGVAPARCGFSLRETAYQPHRLNRRTYLFGDSVADIHAERQAGGKAMSGKLWRALKSLSEES